MKKRSHVKGKSLLKLDFVMVKILSNLCTYFKANLDPVLKHTEPKSCQTPLIMGFKKDTFLNLTVYVKFCDMKKGFSSLTLGCHNGLWKV